jgi:hypothetical protein
MKKLLLAVITVLAVANFTNAQIKKGAIFLGGDISASTQNTKSQNQTSSKQNGVLISPVFGKAIKDNLILGVHAGVGFYNNNYDNDNMKSKSNSYNAGIFLRKYKNIGNSDFYFFMQGGLNGNFSKQTQQRIAPAYNEENKYFNIALSAYPGISYAVTKKLQLETGFNNLLTLSYMNEKRTVGITNYTTNGFSISSSLSYNALSSLYLGFRFLLNK